MSAIHMLNLENTDARNELHCALVELRTRVRARKGKIDTCIGICNNLNWVGASARHLLKEMFKQWPENSGNIAYPVPGAYMFGRPKWGNSAQGQARKRLLDWLIDQTE